MPDATRTARMRIEIETEDGEVIVINEEGPNSKIAIILEDAGLLDNFAEKLLRS